MKEYRPLESKRRSEKIAEKIMEMIETGVLKPGDKLPSEPEFAKQLGISRGILREGLAQLKAQGIISRKPKDGTYILPFQTPETGIEKTTRQAIKVSSFRSIMEMRDAIEQKAAVLVIERASEEELEELREIVLQSSQPVGADDLDYYFHYRLVELSGNVIFMGIVDSYFGEIREIRDKNLNKAKNKDEVLREHLAIVDALCRRDKGAAVQAVETHMNRIWKRWRQREAAETE